MKRIFDYDENQARCPVPTGWTLTPDTLSQKLVTGEVLLHPRANVFATTSRAGLYQPDVANPNWACAYIGGSKDKWCVIGCMK